MPEGWDKLLDPVTAIAFASFVVPGFVGMTCYRLLQPVQPISLKEGLIDAIAFGVVNLVFIWPGVGQLIALLSSPMTSRQEFFLWLLIIVLFLVAPIIEATLLNYVLGVLDRNNLILRRPRGAWDAFFLTKKPAKVLVHLKDGSLLAGQYGIRSFAGLYPNSGNLYLEKVWRYSPEAGFEGPIPDSLGVILRPRDYEFVELFFADPTVPE